MHSTNPELELAFEYISQTKRHVFLTGKAGTGKTTFLHRVRAEVPKRMAVVAPTGVAAINAKGVTLHSLFQLPFGMLTPEQRSQEIGKRRYARKKIDLIRGLDLLIIDEISMVRADVLDAVDAVLRRLRRVDAPFGGLQLLMIGDLHQLPPVVRPEEWYEMRSHYDTPYFFGSQALRQASPTVIQLTHIYRQADADFIDLLNRVRNNQLDAETLAQLNQRYLPDFEPEENEGYITLSSHNKSTREINEGKLRQMQAAEHTFEAAVSGDFPASLYPNEPSLTFKVGAQVMFNKNDTYSDRMYYNGKIGVISDIIGDEVFVKCPGEEVIAVLPVIWENRRYELNAATKEIEEDVIGTYEQHPLKLAWAITIHKSQGLTFEKVIIDAQSAFAHGQVYVALSRCKTFEGIVLRTPIETSSVRTDTVVRDYSQRAAEHPPTEADLRADKLTFQADCLRELFNFSEIEGAANWLRRALLEHERSIQGDALPRLEAIQQTLVDQAVNIGNKFLPRLEVYFREGPLPAEHPELSTRLEKAAGYFIPCLGEALLPPLMDFDILTDNQAVRKQVDERLDRLRLLLFTKWKLFQAIQGGFAPTTYIQAKANAAMDFAQSQSKSKPTRKTTAIPHDLPNRELYTLLAQWRQTQAEAEDAPAYAVAPNRALLEAVQVLPTSTKMLLRVKGFGKKRVEKYGTDIVDIIRGYAQKHALDTDLELEFSTKPAPKPPKVDTKRLTLDLFREGKTPAAIAEARELKATTILGHLAHWIGAGEVPLDAVVKPERAAILQPYLQAHPDTSLGEVFQHFNGAYSYPELRAVRAWLERE